MFNLNQLSDEKKTYYIGTEFEFSASTREFAELSLNKGKLRRSKRKIEHTLTSCGTYRVHSDAKGSAANYVWRMLAFYLIAEKPYSCMPMGCVFDMPYFRKDGSKIEISITKDLDGIVEEILKTIPLQQQRGALRWGKAFGLI